MPCIIFAINEHTVRSLVFFISCLLLCCATQAQDLKKIADSLTAEGRKLYMLEGCAWEGTDHFLAKYTGDRNNVGGYLAYPNAGKTAVVYFSKGDKPMIIGTLLFDGVEKNLATNVKERAMTRQEKDLWMMRSAALAQTVHDTSIMKYKNTQFVATPVIEKGIKKVYLLTGTDLGGVLVMGNDYVLDCNSDNSIKEVHKLHKGIVIANFMGDASDNAQKRQHEHGGWESPYMTTTDIATMMLNEHFTKWDRYTVTSKDYTSVWNIKTDKLTITRNVAKKKVSK